MFVLYYSQVGTKSPIINEASVVTFKAAPVVSAFSEPKPI